MKKLSRKQVEEALASAWQSIGTDDYVLANGALISILKSDPLCVEALRLRAKLLAAMNDFPAAFSHSCVLVSVEPDVATNWRLRGQFAVEVSFKHLAFESFSRAIKLGDKDSQELLDDAAKIDCQCEHCAPEK